MPKVTHVGQPNCETTGKIAYQSRSKAKKHAKDLKRNQGHSKGVYICEHCGMWHVGGAK